MASTYPAALDAFAVAKSDATATITDHAAHHNNLADALTKIEAELGINPKAAFPSVRARTETVETNLTTFQYGDSHLGASLSYLANWRTLFRFSGAFTSPTGDFIYQLGPLSKASNGRLDVAESTGAFNPNPAKIYTLSGVEAIVRAFLWRGADYTIPGRTPELRIRVVASGNASVSNFINASVFSIEENLSSTGLLDIEVDSGSPVWSGGGPSATNIAVGSGTTVATSSARPVPPSDRELIFSVSRVDEPDPSAGNVISVTSELQLRYT